MVYYMVNSDKAGKAGLIFPTETDYPDFRVGHWYVSVDGNGLSEKYSFDTVRNGVVITYELKKVRNNIYGVTTNDLLVYYFRIIPRLYWGNRYVGKSSFFTEEDSFQEVFPIDPNVLTLAAQEHKLFFIGSVDVNLDKS